MLFIPSMIDVPLAIQICFAVTIGLFVGSFLNVVIHRLPKMLSSSWRRSALEELDMEPDEHARFDLCLPGSRCPFCESPIKAQHNVPVLSFIALRGQCHKCKHPIPWRYPIVELIAGAISGLMAARYGLGLEWFFLTGFAMSLLVLGFIDADTCLLPDALTLPLIWVGLLYHVIFQSADLQDAVIGAILGYISLWAVYWLFKLTTGKEGMGYGDFKLLAGLGAWMGWQILPATILIASVLGTLYGMSQILLKRVERHQEMPFGPYLVFAGFIVFWFGADLPI